ncbi:Creatinase/aminopeptidase [Atractiella rhizophila]|nr:Creatinase/aminopeptidase [Atractiella rhizophila]
MLTVLNMSRMRINDAVWRFLLCRDTKFMSFVTAFMSGFTGTAGTAVVTLTSAYMFTDGRFHIQAAQQMDSNWTLVKSGVNGLPDWDGWLLQNVAPGMRVGVDPTLVSIGSINRFSPDLLKRGASFVFPRRNLVDSIWVDKPPLPRDKIHVHPLQYAGTHASEKLSLAQETIQSSIDAQYYLLSSLADIAWTLNLRGNDIPYNPLFLAYLLIGLSETVLFVDLAKLDGEVLRYLVEQLKVTVKSYKTVWQFLPLLSGKCLTSDDISYAIFTSIPPSTVCFLSYPSPILAARGLKNHVELSGFRKGNLRDSVAWVRWAAALECSIEKGEEVNEWEAGERLTRERKRSEQFLMLAKPNISAAGPNAALPHYEPPRVGSRKLDRAAPYLCDSGPHYLDSSIDITRTVHFGRPTTAQKRLFTLALKGHIAIDSAVFPEGTTGYQLDLWARKAAWKYYEDYTHGTGHSVGSCLPIHEGPHGFGKGKILDIVPLQVGHILTNEPGLYWADDFGVRTESMLTVKLVKMDEHGNKWFGFDRLTQIPI